MMQLCIRRHSYLDLANTNQLHLRLVVADIEAPSVILTIRINSIWATKAALCQKLQIRRLFRAKEMRLDTMRMSTVIW